MDFPGCIHLSTRPPRGQLQRFVMKAPHAPGGRGFENTHATAAARAMDGEGVESHTIPPPQRRPFLQSSSPSRYLRPPDRPAERAGKFSHTCLPERAPYEPSAFVRERL